MSYAAGGMRGISILALMMLPLTASAQSTDSTRAAARELGTEGVDDFQAGNFASASDKLDRAFKVVRAPSLGLWSARALVKTGNWVEAAERYLEVTRLDPQTGDVVLQKQAQAEAAKEREELLARLPGLRLDVKNASSAVELQIDGTPLPSVLIGARVPLNPGPHVLEVVDGGRRITRTVEAVEGQVLGVVIDFDTAQSTTPPTPESGPPSAREPSSASDTAPQPAATRKISTGTWIALGVGVAGLAVGATTGVMAMSRKDDLGSSCDDTRCDPSARDDVDSYNALRTVSTIGFVAGGLGVATAGVLFFTAPREPVAARGVVPWVGLGAAGVRGRF